MTSPAMLGTGPTATGAHIPQARRSQMLGACTTRTGTCGSGAPRPMSSATTAVSREAPRLPGGSVCCWAARGTAARTSAAPPLGAGTSRRTGAASTGFGSCAPPRGLISPLPHLGSPVPTNPQHLAGPAPLLKARRRIASPAAAVKWNQKAGGHAGPGRLTWPWPGAERACVSARAGQGGLPMGHGIFLTACRRRAFGEGGL